jgi:diguanylate cyclase (GGDEF)-like protein/PAS domain S-box-containing protein
MSFTEPAATADDDAAAEISRLKHRLADAEAIVDAIRAGQIDALLIPSQTGGQVLELQGVEHDYRLLVEEMGEGALTLTASGRIYFTNRRFAAMLGTTRETLVGTALSERIAPAERSLYQAWLDRPSPRAQHRLALHLVDADGSEIPCHISLTELPLETKQGAFSVIATDLSVQKRAEDALRHSEQRLKTIVENLPIGIWFLDRSGKITYGNPTATAIWGGALFVGAEDLSAFKAWPLNGERPLAAHDLAVSRAIGSGETTLNEELEIECLDGTHRIILNSAVPIRDGLGEIVGAVVINQDITARKAAEKQIEQLAFFDGLTRLPNRRLLLDRLGQVLAAIQRSGRHGALLFVDLDQFKDLNDSLGHDIGDLLLKHVAQRLTSCVRAQDTVARLGGDEFVVVIENLSVGADRAAAQARSVAGKIQQALSRPYQLGHHVQHSTPSIGVTLIDAAQHSVDELLKQADLAMYQAKEAGRNKLRFFDPAMQTALDLRTALEIQLRQGLQRRQFELHYQPLVDRAGVLFGAEALLRWNHPERGLLRPDLFIPLAEESGLIVPLGEWVLTAACEQLAIWSQHARSARRSLAVNISARQFRDPEFVSLVRRILVGHRVDPQLLELELTESLLLEDIDDSIDKMAALRALGLRFALDDFGTGYSSLAYLKRLPLDVLKIDRSFITDVSTDPNDAAIVRAILALAPQLGLSVIAEGVETESQRQFLARNGCGAFQGYLFGRPGPVEALLADDDNSG